MRHLNEIVELAVWMPEDYDQVRTRCISPPFRL